MYPYYGYSGTNSVLARSVAVVRRPLIDHTRQPVDGVRVGISCPFELSPIPRPPHTAQVRTGRSECRTYGASTVANVRERLREDDVQ